MKKTENSGDDLIAGIREIIEDVLLAGGESGEMVGLIIDKIVDIYGGFPWYIKKCNPQDKIDRNRAMIAKFNGRNRRELCQEYDISEVHFYNILKKARDEMQDDLFKQ